MGRAPVTKEQTHNWVPPASLVRYQDAGEALFYSFNCFKLPCIMVLELVSHLLMLKEALDLHFGKRRWQASRQRKSHDVGDTALEHVGYRPGMLSHFWDRWIPKPDLLSTLDV